VDVRNYRRLLRCLVSVSFDDSLERMSTRVNHLESLSGWFCQEILECD